MYVTDLGMYDRKQFNLIRWTVLVHYILYHEMALFSKYYETGDSFSVFHNQG